VSTSLAPTTARARRAEGASYRLRNLRTHIREFPFNARVAAGRLLGMPSFVTELRATLHHADGSDVDLGVLSRKIVTTAGVNYLASTFTGTGSTPVINWHAAGTGATAAAIGDTAMQTDSGVARVSGTQSNPSANLYKSIATLAFVSTLAITEWGFFTAVTTGTMFDHFVFTAVNVVSGDSITFTFTLTLTAGG
jgi:hypothetical protein